MQTGSGNGLGTRLDIMSEELVVEPHAVTKLPDAKPLRLIGCFSLMQKKYSSGNLLLVGILTFYAVNTRVSYQNSCLRGF